MARCVKQPRPLTAATAVSQCRMRSIVCAPQPTQSFIQVDGSAMRRRKLAEVSVSRHPD